MSGTREKNNKIVIGKPQLREVSAERRMAWKKMSHICKIWEKKIIKKAIQIVKVWNISNYLDSTKNDSQTKLEAIRKKSGSESSFSTDGTME